MRARVASPLEANYGFESSPGLHDRGCESRLWSVSGRTRQDPEFLLLAISGRSAHRELRPLHPQHRTFGQCTDTRNAGPVEWTGVSLSWLAEQPEPLPWLW